LKQRTYEGLKNFVSEMHGDMTDITEQHETILT